MRTNLQRYRFLGRRLEAVTTPRLVLLTGARQTGKTTLARHVFPDLNYLNLDSTDQRAAVREVRAESWAESIGPAILDEAQKEPELFDKVKFAFDAGELPQSVLLGSSQILMLQRVRETLAGRIFIYELWPLLASELAAPAKSTPAPPLLHHLLTEIGSADELLGQLSNVRVGKKAVKAAQAVEHLLQWGGMPALLPLADEEREKWLQSYETTYLERDLADLTRLADLMPFRRFQQLAALRSGQILSLA